jgi:hypothetical protein
VQGVKEFLVVGYQGDFSAHDVEPAHVALEAGADLPGDFEGHDVGTLGAALEATVLAGVAALGGQPDGDDSALWSLLRHSVSETTWRSPTLMKRQPTACLP